MFRKIYIKDLKKKKQVCGKIKPILPSGTNALRNISRTISVNPR